MFGCGSHGEVRSGLLKVLLGSHVSFSCGVYGSGIAVVVRLVSVLWGGFLLGSYGMVRLRIVSPGRSVTVGYVADHREDRAVREIYVKHSKL